jgi:hypothetical protein
MDEGRGDAPPLLAEGIGHDRPHDAARGGRSRRLGPAGRRFRGLAAGFG